MSSVIFGNGALLVQASVLQPVENGRVAVDALTG